MFTPYAYIGLLYGQFIIYTLVRVGPDLIFHCPDLIPWLVLIQGREILNQGKQILNQGKKYQIRGKNIKSGQGNIKIDNFQIHIYIYIYIYITR